MKFSEEYGERILREYNVEERSIEQIAADLGTYPNKIRRTIIQMGGTLRSRSESQKIALREGRSKPPMEGKTHTEATRNKISDGVHKKWDELSEDEREERCEKARSIWNSMSADEREVFQKAGHQAIREASKEGSKLEKYLSSVLTQAGHNVIIHKKALIANVDLELDIVLPDLNVVVEVDGPSHFLPIWGEESLRRNMKADQEKSGLLLAEGYCVIRVKDYTTSRTKRSMRLAGEKLMYELGKIEKKFPGKGERLIEVEIR